MGKILTVKVTLSKYPGEADTWQSRIESSPRGASSGMGVQFKLPPIPRKMATYSEYLRAATLNGAEVNSELRTLGTALFAGLFQGETRDKLNNVLGALDKDEDDKLRIALNILSPELVEVPWEFMHDGNNFLAQDSNYSIVRIIDELIIPKKSFGPIAYPMIIVANPLGGFESAKHLQMIKDEFKRGNVNEENIRILEDADPNNIFDFINSYPDTDFLYFLGHGAIGKDGEGYVILQDDQQASGTQQLPAQNFANFIKKQKNLRLVFFNSCSTAEPGSGTFSGVAQKTMQKGDVVSVVAMQASIESERAMVLSSKFIRYITRIETIEDALSFARSEFLTDKHTWGIPVIYTHLQGPDEFEKNQLLSLFSSPERGEKYALCIPSFKNTLLEEEMMKFNVHIAITDNKEKEKTYNINDVYHYPGLSFAQSDVRAVNYIQMLLSKITADTNIKIVPGSRISQETESRCIFLFGSRSNTYVSQILGGYKQEFEMEYTSEEWQIIDLLNKKKYAIKPPYKYPREEWDKIADYAIIQKLLSPGGEKAYILISGLGDRGTIGGSWWLTQNWKKLLKEAGTNPFSRLLRFPTANHSDIEVIDRSNNKYGIINDA